MACGQRIRCPAVILHRRVELSWCMCVGSLMSQNAPEATATLSMTADYRGPKVLICRQLHIQSGQPAHSIVCNMGCPPVVLAFILTVAAGLATMAGAACVWFVPGTVDMSGPLALCLGIGGGVMIYVSFVELFANSAIQGFHDAGYTDTEARRYATLSFFGGMLIIWLLDRLVHIILQCSKRMEERRGKACTGMDVMDKSTICKDVECPVAAVTIPGAVDTSESCEARSLSTDSSQLRMTELKHHNSEGWLLAERQSEAEAGMAEPDRARSADGVSEEVQSPAVHVLDVDKEHEALAHTGVLTALAIAIHNLPEGLATFVATMAQPTAGVVVALAIALHNIPEGIVVAMPLCAASGSKWKGFMWGSLSGLTEPLGALVGFAIIGGGDSVPPTVDGVMLGIVAGMMVGVSLTDLLPAAFKYDPSHVKVILGIVSGMVVMATSLLLFDM